MPELTFYLSVCLFGAWLMYRELYGQNKPLFKITDEIFNDNDGKLSYRLIAEPDSIDGVAREYIYENGETASISYAYMVPFKGVFLMTKPNFENMIKYNKGYRRFQKKAEELRLNGRLYAGRKR